MSIYQRLFKNEVDSFLNLFRKKKPPITNCYIAVIKRYKWANTDKGFRPMHNIDLCEPMIAFESTEEDFIQALRKYVQLDIVESIFDFEVLIVGKEEGLRLLRNNFKDLDFSYYCRSVGHNGTPTYVKAMIKEAKHHKE